MSATAEVLMEQIRLINDQIAEAESRGTDTSVLYRNRKELMDRFYSIQRALNENTQVLKG